MNPDKAKQYYDVFPILLTICLVPFVVFCHVYEYTDDSFGTFAEGIALTDFFSYTKSLVFGIIALYMLYRILFDTMQGRLTRPCISLSVCFVIMGAALIISGFAALNRTLAFYGGYQRFEGVFTKIFYMILALYTFRIIGDPGIRRIIWKGLMITTALEDLVGLAQMTGHDPFAMKPVMDVILPKALEGSEITNILGDSRVYLTLGNPNYAAMYLAIMIIIITWSLRSVNSRKLTAALVVLDILSFAELTATRSRAGFLMLAGAAVIWLIKSLRSIHTDRKKALYVCALIAAMLAVGILTDAVMGLGTFDRIGSSLKTLGQDRKNSEITGIETNEDAVVISAGGSSVSVSFGDGMDTEHLQIINGKEGTFPEDIRFSVESIDEEPMIALSEGDMRLYFSYDADLGYQIYAGNGYYEYAEEIPYIDMHGLNSFASGRGYIWSRTIPLIRGHRILTGYGSDNFYLAFPQNDYVGKAQYCESPYVTIEKPHNTYLLYAVENGIPAMLVFVIMTVMLTVRCLKSGDNEDRYGFLISMILAAYALGFMFNDSSIVISPLFWIAVGAGFRQSDNSVLSK